MTLSSNSRDAGGKKKHLRFPPLHENGIKREDGPPKKGEGEKKAENDNRKGNLCNYHEAKHILIPCFHGKSFNSTG